VTSSDQVVVERRDRAGRQVADVHGAAAIEFAPSGGTDLAFLAPDRPGREVALPIGPLRLMEATTGAIRVILSGSVVAFFWSPDGGTIAALEIPVPPDDTVAQAAGSGAAILARAAGEGRARTVADAPGVGLRLVFVESATGSVRSERDVQIGTVFAAQVLPYFDQYALSHRFWSPDGRSVALPVAADDGTEAIVVFPADGGPATRIADGVVAAWGP